VSTRRQKKVLISVVTALVLCLEPRLFGAVIHVTNDFPTIQAAINAAGSNDTIQIQAGTYREFLNITAPVRIIGTGSTNCIIHHTNDVLVTITSAGTVELTGMEICGGEVAFGGGFSPTVPCGIIASNTTLSLNDVAVNMTRNFAVTVMDGSLFATNVALYTRIVLVQWDVGFQLKGCFARIYQLTQQAGQIDHTININDPPANFSDVHVENSTIRASHLGYGECIRTYTQSSVVISNCYLYRASGGDAVSIGNQAIGVNGYSNTVVITGNLIDSLPTGIRVFGSIPNSNKIRIEYNDITNCQSNGVVESSMSYEGIDLGGGVAQSAGQNAFSNPGARDVELTGSTGNIHALSNCWTTANPDDSIIDHTDTPALGQVFYTPTYCAPVIVDCVLVPSLVTNVVGLADTVHATVTTNGGPAVGASVVFSVVSGPNSGQGTNVVTDSSGQVSFVYSGNGSMGTDTIRAIATVASVSATGTASKVWIGTPPLVICPADIITNTVAGTCARTLTYNPPASGMPAPVVTLSPPSGSTFLPGITSVTVIASNVSGVAQCSFNVTVNDNELPLIACPADVVTNITLPQTQVNVVFGAPVVSDNCGTVATSCAPASGSAFPLGTNTVTCTAIDVAANTNTCTFRVIVLGLPAPNQPPVALCSNITVNADSNCQATVAALAIDAGSFDNDGTITSRSLGPAGPFDMGTNDVVLTVYDNNGASNTCQAQVIVVDTTPPSLGACTNIFSTAANGVAIAVVNFPTPSASDNCMIATNYCSPASGSVFPIGTTVVTNIAVDTSGNTNTCTFNIIVDAMPPATHDLMVVSITPPKRVTLSESQTNQTKGVKVTIENLGNLVETITDLDMLTNVVTLTVESLGVCPSPAKSLVPPRKGFPVVLAPKKKLTLLYNVAFDCANDPLATTKDADHTDFRYTVTINSVALDGDADLQPSNDVCPRPPNPAIGDKGCGSKDPVTKQLGADVLSDIIVK